MVKMGCSSTPERPPGPSSWDRIICLVYSVSRPSPSQPDFSDYCAVVLGQHLPYRFGSKYI